MLYQLSCNGQSYGPYTLEDLQRYIGSGNILPTDLAKGDETPEWVPVAQVLGAAAPAAGFPAVAPAAYTGSTPVYAPGAAARHPDPPNLHWARALVIGIFTCGLFWVVWGFVQAIWMRKVNPRSNALFLYIAYTVLAYGGGIVRFALIAASGFHNLYNGMDFPLGCSRSCWSSRHSSTCAVPWRSTSTARSRSACRSAVS